MNAFLLPRLWTLPQARPCSHQRAQSYGVLLVTPSLRYARFISRTPPQIGKAKGGGNGIGIYRMRMARALKTANSFS